MGGEGRQTSDSDCFIVSAGRVLFEGVNPIRECCVPDEVLDACRSNRIEIRNNLARFDKDGESLRCIPINLICLGIVCPESDSTSHSNRV